MVDTSFYPSSRREFYIPLCPPLKGESSRREFTYYPLEGVGGVNVTS